MACLYLAEGKSALLHFFLRMYGSHRHQSHLALLESRPRGMNGLRLHFLGWSAECFVSCRFPNTSCAMGCGHDSRPLFPAWTGKMLVLNTSFLFGTLIRASMVTPRFILFWMARVMPTPPGNSFGCSKLNHTSALAASCW